MDRPSIYDAVGGMPAFLALAAANHERCLADPVLNHPFSHPGHPQHVARLGAYWAAVLGGPPAEVTHTGMLGIHANMDADHDLGERFLACFLAAIDDVGLPDDAELRAALRAYMEWATTEVMTYSPRDAVVPANAPMPRWSWDGLVTD